jgi:hypothetical protein
MIPAGTDVLSIKGRNQRNTDILSGKKRSQGKICCQWKRMLLEKSRSTQCGRNELPKNKCTPCDVKQPTKKKTFTVLSGKAYT